MLNYNYYLLHFLIELVKLNNFDCILIYWEDPVSVQYHDNNSKPMDFKAILSFLN